MKIQVVILLVIVSALAAQDSSQIYCGRRLARTLSVLCYSQNYVMKRAPEIETVGMKRSDYAEAYDNEREYILPWMAEKEARGLNSVRGKRQVATECCDKACTIDELLSYC